MKKLIIAVSLLTLAACTKSGTTSSSSPGSTTSIPTSTFNITFNGKTYNLNSSITGTAIVVTTKSNPGTLYGNNSSCNCNYAGYSVGIVAGSSQMSCEFIGGQLSASTALGTYKSGAYGGCDTFSTFIFYGSIMLVDHNDGNKEYWDGNECGHAADTTSMIAVTVANANECKGTFSVQLYYNGNYYPATGDFDYKH